MGTDVPVSREERIREALREIRPGLRSHFRKFRCSHEDAEDILQESLLIVLKRWNEIDQPAGYIFGTVRLQTLLFLRRQRKQREVSVDEGSLENIGSGKCPQEDSERRHDVRALLAVLPGRGGRLVEMRYGEGLSSDEIAAELCYSAGSVRKLAARHLRRLQRHAASLGFRR